MNFPTSRDAPTITVALTSACVLGCSWAAAPALAAKKVARAKLADNAKKVNRIRASSALQRRVVQAP
jgi:hypothetical protein